MNEQLTDHDKQLLAFAGGWWKYPGARDNAIRQQFGMTPTRYYQALNTLLDRPAAYEHDPMLIKRLRRLRDQRRAGTRSPALHQDRAAGTGVH